MKKLTGKGFLFFVLARLTYSAAYTEMAKTFFGKLGEVFAFGGGIVFFYGAYLAVMAIKEDNPQATSKVIKTLMSGAGLYILGEFGPSIFIK